MQGMGNCRHLLPFLLLCAALSPASAGDWSGEASLGHDSNVTNAREGSRERDDRFAQLSLGIDRPWRLGPASTLLWRPQLEAQQFDQYQGLSNLQAGLQGRWLYRPAAGFHVPVFELLAGASWWEFDSGLRDSAQYRVGLFATGQLSTRISLRAGGQVQEREAESAVFDNRQASLGADLDWELAPGALLYLGYRHLDGDFVATAPSAPPAAGITQADDVFDGETSWRFSGRAHSGTLGFNYSLSPALALDLQARRTRTRADSGVRYERDQFLASLLWRWP